MQGRIQVKGRQVQALQEGHAQESLQRCEFMSSGKASGAVGCPAQPVLSPGYLGV